MKAAPKWFGRAIAWVALHVGLIGCARTGGVHLGALDQPLAGELREPATADDKRFFEVRINEQSPAASWLLALDPGGHIWQDARILSDADLLTTMRARARWDGTFVIQFQVDAPDRTPVAQMTRAIERIRAASQATHSDRMVVILRVLVEE